MVAELSTTTPTPLPLLLPPDRPSSLNAKRTHGWRWKRTCRPAVLERRPQDDGQGAVIQWAVLRYYRDYIPRKVLARQHSFSERVFQDYLSGKGGWGRAYAAPVRRALVELGIPLHGHTTHRPRRLPSTGVPLLLDAAVLLQDDPRPASQRLVRAVRLLTVQPDGGMP